MEAPAALLPLWSWPLVAATTSAVLTEAAIGYARRRALIDQPGYRRMHRVPTPRGGGIGIVAAAFLVCVVLPWPGVAPDRRTELVALALGLLAVAGAGAWDDHRSLPALPKLVAHLVAAALCVAANGSALLASARGAVGPDLAVPAALLCGGLVVLAIVWSINLHNFMDGINGLLASQAAFVFAALAWLPLTGLDAAQRWGMLAIAAAALAFLPFNFPQARVFMGDVASGVLGLLVAATTWRTPAALLLLMLNSAFIVDARATLVARLLRGRRWYSAHREHLYQWLARSGFSHAQVVGLYALWNLCIALPSALIYLYWPRILAGLSVRPVRDPILPAPPGPVWLIALVLLSGTVLWWFGRRWCLVHVRAAGCRHAA